MKKVVLIIVGLGLLAGDFSAQSRKRKGRDPHLVSVDSPCGIKIPSYDEFMEERKVEWREIGETPETIVYYNTRKNVCDKGTLKIWTKSYDKPAVSPTLDELSEAAEKMVPQENKNKGGFNLKCNFEISGKEQAAIA